MQERIYLSPRRQMKFQHIKHLGYVKNVWTQEKCKIIILETLLEIPYDGNMTVYSQENVQKCF